MAKRAEIKGEGGEEGWFVVGRAIPDSWTLFNNNRTKNEPTGYRLNDRIILFIFCLCLFMAFFHRQIEYKLSINVVCDL